MVSERTGAVKPIAKCLDVLRKKFSSGAHKTWETAMKRFFSEFKKYWKYKYLVLMFLPAVAYFVIFKYIPIGGMALAFKSFQIMKGIWGSPWCGLDNFYVLFQSAAFWQSFKNTLIISTYKLVIGFPAPIIFALLLNEVRQSRVKKVIQTVSYLPHFLSWVILAGIFMQFLSPSIGPFNILLKRLGLNPVFFLGDPHVFRGTLVGTHIWQSVGWGSIVYIAALAGVDVNMYEAAELDGANRFQKMWYITLPSIASVITIMLILAVGKIVTDDFDQIYNLYNPGVYSVSEVMGTYIYKRGIGNMQYEVSTAMGLFQNAIAFVMVAITNRISRKVNEYGLW